MSNYIKVNGNPKNGIVLLRDDGVIRSLSPVEPAGDWQQSPAQPADSAKKGKDETPPFVFLNNTGFGAGGTTTLAQQNNIQYLTSLGNDQAVWKTLQPELGDIALSAVTGDVDNGYMLLSSDGKTAYQLSADGKEWKPFSTPLPFKNRAKFIVGDVKSGVLAVSDDPSSALARSTSDCCGWSELKPAPVRIDLITGDFAKGFVVLGEGKLYALTVAKDATWTPLPTPKFQFKLLAGNPADGLVAVIADSSGASNTVVYTTAPAKGPWPLALAATA